MQFCIIIPAHNEEAFIGLTLTSLTAQTKLPAKVIVVNDNSNDNTASIVQEFIYRYPWISLLENKSSDSHIPGEKVIKAFYMGLLTCVDEYDIVCKFDADVIFPSNYLEKVESIFESNLKIGMAGGILYVKNDEEWTYENISKKTHLRGPIKAYRKKCFEEIGGLKSSIGWDTVDGLLARYNGWEIEIDPTLIVKHLKPTGEKYNKASKYFQGEAMYKMRYGLIITLIAALKLAYNKKSVSLIGDYIKGFLKAKRNNVPHLVTEKEGRFIRSLRWKGILNSIKTFN